MSARIEAAAKASFIETYSATWESWEAATEYVRDLYRNRVRPVLEAADAVDPLRHPDELAVEKVADALAKADGWLSLTHPSPRHQQLLRERARLVVATLTEAG